MAQGRTVGIEVLERTVRKLHRALSARFFMG